jgi:hypothetical protein
MIDIMRVRFLFWVGLSSVVSRQPVSVSGSSEAQHGEPNQRRNVERDREIVGGAEADPDQISTE